MANVTQTLTLVGEPVPFSDVPPGENNIYPRARIVFQVRDSTITAKAAGNTNQLIIVADLPVNFAYVIDSLFCSVRFVLTADAENYNDRGTMGIQFTSPGGGNDVSTFVQSGGVGPSEDAAHFSKIFTQSQQADFHEIFFSRSRTNAAARIAIRLFDEDGTNATAAGEFDAYISVLQYNILQADKVVVNAPMPVATR